MRDGRGKQMENAKLEIEGGTEKGIKAEGATARGKIEWRRNKTERTRTKKERIFKALPLVLSLLTVSKLKKKKARATI